MAKSTALLETSTVTLDSLLGNGRIYRVPPYQRDYSWDVENWDDLWSDILALRAGDEQRHYMGTIVLQAKSDREQWIIDGQQRFTTLSLLAIVVIKRLNELVARGIDPADNEQRSEILRRKYLGDKDPRNLLYSSKLFLNANNDGYYQSYLLQLREPPAPHRLSATDQLLRRAYEYFDKRVGELSDLQDDGERLTGFFTDEVARKLLFIQIAVEDELSAYTVFETLNARGVELTSTDLLKNYLFSLIPQGDLVHVQPQWKRLADTVGTDRLPDFLRHLINSQQPQIRAQRLFKTVKERVRNGQEALALLDELEREGDVYSALFDANHERWREHKELRPMVRALRLFNVKQVAPLLLAAYRRLSIDAYERVVRLVEVISFRFNVIGDNNPNDLERSYGDAAAALHHGTITTPRKLFESLKSIYVPDEKFEQDFATKSLKTARRKELVRYVLYRLERDAGGGTAGIDDDTATIEHILPDNPSLIWGQTFPIAEQDQYIHRLGNYTLLEPGHNRTLANESFDKKRAVYQTSRYALARNILVETWTPDALSQRQEQLARRAVHLWRVDYT